MPLLSGITMGMEQNSPRICCHLLTKMRFCKWGTIHGGWRAGGFLGWWGSSSVRKIVSMIQPSTSFLVPQ
jgi:hypothetical protein